jgi:MGT family glycosyltransferase
MIALGEELADRGHDVTLQTWSRWRNETEARGMRFAAAPEYPVFPTSERPMKPYQAVFQATLDTDSLVAETRPEMVVADILTLAPALAAERQGIPFATLVPHVYPVSERGWPPYSLGARLPRSAAGRLLWQRLERLTAAGLELGRSELNETRRRLSLPPLDRVHGGISADLCLVATLPELEYPRRWPDHVHVVGPMHLELDAQARQGVTPPAGDGPLVIVAPSTVHDPGHKLVRDCLEAFADLPVRILASVGQGDPDPRLRVPGNARVVQWLPYGRAMSAADLVICHAGHGTLVRALSAGAPVLAVPAAGDMNENAARLSWAGLGLRLPRRLAGPSTVRAAALRALADVELRTRVRGLAQSHGPRRAAELLEAYAARRPLP